MAHVIETLAFQTGDFATIWSRFGMGLGMRNRDHTKMVGMNGMRSIVWMYKVMTE